MERKFKESDKNSFKEQIKPIIFKFFESFISNKQIIFYLIYLNYYFFSVSSAEQFLKIACNLFEFKEQERTFVFTILKKVDPTPTKKPGGIMGLFGKK